MHDPPDRVSVLSGQGEHEHLVEPEHEHHRHPGRRALGVAEVFEQFIVGDVGLRQQRRISPAPRQGLAQLVPDAPLIGLVSNLAKSPKLPNRGWTP